MKQYYERSRLRRILHRKHDWRFGLWVQHDRKAVTIGRCNICGQYGIALLKKGVIAMIPSLEQMHMMDLVKCILWLDKEEAT
jgi:hypothetical protein